MYRVEFFQFVEFSITNCSHLSGILYLFPKGRRKGTGTPAPDGYLPKCPGAKQTFFIHSSFSFFFFSKRKTAAQEQGPARRLFFCRGIFFGLLPKVFPRRCVGLQYSKYCGGLIAQTKTCGIIKRGHYFMGCTTPGLGCAGTYCYNT